MPIIKQNQTLLDLVVQYTGELSNLFVVALQNSFGITNDMGPGNGLLPTIVTDKRTTKFFDRIDYDVVTFIGNNDNTNEQGGIGYMQIGTDFRVR